MDPKALGVHANMAQCHEALGQPVKAHAEYTQLLTKATEKKQVERVTTARARLGELEKSLVRVTVRLTHNKEYAADCTNCETKEGMLDRIDRTVTLEGALDDAQRKRLMEIADKCPVHRTLTSEIDIRTSERPA